MMAIQDEFKAMSGIPKVMGKKLKNEEGGLLFDIYVFCNLKIRRTICQSMLMVILSSRKDVILVLLSFSNFLMTLSIQHYVCYTHLSFFGPQNTKNHLPMFLLFFWQ